MKLFKLHIHEKNSNQDLILNPKEHPDAKIGDIVEIYHPEDENYRLLLQITCFNEELKGRETISVESNIAAAFNLRNYGDVIMRTVSPDSVALDSVEITFKDQYMGRSEMWRLKEHLLLSCVYLNKKIEFCKGDIRCQVYEMWSKGDRVACGVITSNTKVVFRSSTSMVYLFIQMSSEMWDFDIHGDLYFEKAVNGFLLDLFQRWKKMGCNHEVTIVLFSRTFYAAKSLDEFPLEMRECLQMDYKGRFYEDFYRVAIQNERCDDWSTVLVQLRRLFTSYQDMVLKYHEKRPGIVIPKATNSTAAQGNFLEVLNISLNVFEKHYLDRSFDRTGQLSVVITPGVGVFEVDRELTNVTKQRIIDNGVGSDLVCVGEQPLHAVPLLKFHNKDVILGNADDYSMPHWINLSFYSTNKKIAYSKFIPRIKLPPLINNGAGLPTTEEDKENQRLRFVSDSQQTECIHNCLFDYDAYDSKIFLMAQPPAPPQARSPRTKKVSIPSLDGTTTGSMIYSTSNEWTAIASTPPLPRPIFRRKLSDPDLANCGTGMTTGPGSPCSNYSGSLVSEAKFGRRSVASGGSPFPSSTRPPGRALINPFDPSHVTIKLTSNRRRWTHIFPKGPTGVLIQQHHYQAVPGSSPQNKLLEESENGLSADSVLNTESMDEVPELEGVVDKLIGDETRRKSATLHSAAGASVTVTPSKSLTLLWGATGEQEWTPALTTAGKVIIGVDWKSLTVPACLPITTDYFPDKRALNNDYVVSNYTLLPDDVNADYASNRAVYTKPLTTAEVYMELISQRLAQGFQLIISPATNNNELGSIQNGTTNGLANGIVAASPIRNGPLASPAASGIMTKAMSPQPTEEATEQKLSIGRIFHKISLVGNTITVTRYRPRHPYSPINVGYRYRFHAPQHDTYEVSGVNFTTEKLENYPWNYVDHYICTRGDFELILQENWKYWRYRMYLLPKEHPAMKKILEGKSARCDIYTDVPQTETWKQQIDDFLRYVELHLNKIKGKKPRGSPTTQQQSSHLTQRRNSTSIISRPPPNQGLGNSPFRERVGSNRLPERHRPRVTRVIPSRITDGNFLGLTNEANLDDPSDVLASEIKFTTSTPLTELCEAMKHPVTGVGFLGRNTSIPSCTFVSHDAIQWLQNRVEGPFDALAILERMREANLIRHASGDSAKPIIQGFMLYYMVQQNKEAPEFAAPLNDLQAFENEWMEVEVRPPSEEDLSSADPANVPKFLRDNVSPPKLDDALYKQIYLEVDTNHKSDRVEWGHLRYHRAMTPGHAFEMVVQWVAASGPIVFELINGWNRKAQQSRFHFIPIPADPVAEPFAEPFTEKSDPLRGPIFVPLNVDCLLRQVGGSNGGLFEEFRGDSRKQRLLLFQEEILARFGFMPCATETTVGSDQRSLDSQYVHCSGLMFILIPSIMDGLRCRKHLLSESSAAAAADAKAAKQSMFARRYLMADGMTPPEPGSFITRHVSGKKKEDCDNVWSTGFLWSWNHMIANKKWKSWVISSSAEGEIIQIRMLKDFKAFCANENDRLRIFWEDCWRRKQNVENNCNNNTE